VRAECATALGEQRTPKALAALVAAVGDAHPRARRAIAAALGRFRTEATQAIAADALSAWIERGDASYLVEAETRRALGKTRDPRAFAILSGRYATDHTSWNDCVLAGTVDGLGALRDAAAIPTLLDALDPKHATSVRRSAIAALASTREVTSDEPLIETIRQRLEGVMDTFDPGIRIGASRTLAVLRDPRSSGAIQRLVDRDVDGRVRRAARESLRDLRERAARGRDVAGLRDDVEKLRNEVRELREKLAVTEAKSTAEPVKNGGEKKPG
jgi:aminopeptidase N